MPFIKEVRINVSSGTKLITKMAIHISTSTKIFLWCKKKRGFIASRSVCIVWNIFATRQRTRELKTPMTARITDFAAASLKLLPEKEIIV